MYVDLLIKNQTILTCFVKSDYINLFGKNQTLLTCSVKIRLY